MSSRTRTVRGERQKEMVRLFESLTGRNNSWTVWTDFVVMAATAISNCVDHAHAEAREREYKTRASKYTTQELAMFSEMLATLVMAIEENPNQDFLGELYMSLGLGSEHAGQFFTPYDVCLVMSKISMPGFGELTEKKGWVGVMDCACGAGATLIAAANTAREMGINYQNSMLFVAQDIDYVVACMCYLQLSLLGCAGYIVIDDSIIRPSTSFDSRGLIPRDNGNVWYTPMYFHEIWHWRRVFAMADMLIPTPHAELPEVDESQTAEEYHTLTGIKEDPPTLQHEELELQESASGQLSFF